MAKASTDAFKKATLARLSAMAADYLQVTNNGEAISNMLLDLIENESAGVIGGTSNAPSAVVAVKLAKTTGDWEERLPTGLWRMRDGDWMVVGNGKGAPKLEDTADLSAVIPILSNDHSLSSAWLTAEIDHPRALKACRGHLAVTVSKDNFETIGNLKFTEPIDWHSISWILPTNLVRDPLASFTVAQNPAAFLNLPYQFRHLDANPLTNQFCAWAMGQMPLQTYMGWPVESTNMLQMLVPELTDAIGPTLRRYNKTDLVWMPRFHHLVWTGMRVVAPEIYIPQEMPPFCVLSCFPLAPIGKPVSPTLWSEVERQPSLVYYDWEMTGMRLQQWRLLWGILTFRPVPRVPQSLDFEGAKDVWLGSIDPSIGRTVTQITAEKPDELRVYREGPVLLTGFEMVVLADWIARGPLFAN